MSDHHEHEWSEELVFDDDLDSVVGEYICEGCDACGLTCDECDGEGCWACGGSGIAVVPGVTVDWEIES